MFNNTACCFSDELVEADMDWDIETLVGTSVTGFIIGVIINIMVFALTKQRTNVAAKIEFPAK